MAFFIDKFKSHPALQAQKAAAMGVQDAYQGYAAYQQDEGFGFQGYSDGNFDDARSERSTYSGRVTTFRKGTQMGP
jgi:hypothetical protein